ncbi:uncharacterized protein LOC106672712 [Cimex lectularius]|uniref:RNase H type-1 domain-containing protein n=1 Tax=Cimex lectularius TaxID=79782 RepID=A0A8I6S8I4_CIMLE|nr:uncharacterized protein LOC106672712 [Cimex lectularius]
MEYVEKNVEKAMNILRCTSKVKYGSHPSIGLMMYRALILARIDYGSIVYGSAAKSHLKKLETVQHRAIRLCLGALGSSPTNSLKVEANTEPLHLRRNRLTTKFLATRMHDPNHPVVTGLDALAVTALSDPHKSPRVTPPLLETHMKMKSISLGKIIRSSNTKLHWLIPLFAPKVITCLQELKGEQDYIKVCFETGKSPLATVVYTDGSKSQCGVGAAILNINNDYSRQFKLPPLCTIFSAEAIAIREAIKYIKQTKPAKTIICSDSLSVLTALKKTDTPEDPIILEIKNILLAGGSGITTHLLWVKGHNNNRFNQRVDALAKAAALSGNDIKEISAGDIVSHNRVLLRKKWQSEYEQSSKSKGIWYSAAQPNIQSKPWFSNVKRNRKFFTTICRLRFNHNKLPSHLHKIGITQTSKCSCDGTTTADANHIILGCPLKTTGREHIFMALKKYKIPLPTTVLIDSMNSYASEELRTYQRFSKLLAMASVLPSTPRCPQDPE